MKSFRGFIHWWVAVSVLVLAGQVLAIPSQADLEAGFLPESATCQVQVSDLIQGFDFLGCLWVAAQPESLASSPDSTEWQPLQERFLNRGFTRHPHWIAGRFVVAGDRRYPAYLEIGYGLLDSLNLQVWQDDTLVVDARAGDRQPFADRPVHYPSYAFPLMLEPGSAYRFILKVQSTSSMQVPLKLWLSDDFIGEKYDEALFLGLLIGMILIMACYNLFLYVALRDLAYLYFAVCLIGYAGVEAILSSVAFAYLWPNAIYWNEHALITVANLALAAQGLFARRFLNLSQSLPLAAKLIQWEVALCGVLMLLGAFLPYRVMILLTCLTVVAVPATTYVASIVLYRHRDTAARYFVLAFTAFVISATVFVFGKLGWLPRSFFTEYSIHFGAISVVALLSFALADRVNRERREKEEAQQTSIESLEKYRLLYENSLEGMFRMNLNGDLLAVNPACARFLGVMDESALLAQTSTLRELVPADEENRRKLARILFKEGQVFGYEAECRRLDGSPFWAAIFARVLEDKETGERVIEGSLIDITDRKQSEERLNYLARHDPLTGLLNRSEMDSRLQRALIQSREGKGQHAFVFLDLDQFKVVNDTCGHRAGDALLKQLSALFKRHLRNRDALARLGGDEFGILLEHCDLERAESISESIRRDVNSYRFNWNAQVFRVGASIGVVPILPDLESIDQVTSMADIACYAAKEQGRDKVVVHRENQDELSRRKNEMELVHIIKEAATQGRFELHFQRIIACPPANDRPGDRIEILLRMQGDHGLLLPGTFLPVAERYNFISEIDCWVVEETLQWIQQEPDRLSGLCQVNINLSGQTISHPSANQRIMELLQANPEAAERLCFEITEHSAITNITETVHFIKGLRGQGIHFALDDFGSGFSSYNHLKHLPISSLKVDGSFIREIVEDQFDYAMVKSIAEIAHAMGLTVVAEFVESKAILALLLDLGIDYVQGYYLHTPEPLSDYTFENQTLDVS